VAHLPMPWGRMWYATRPGVGLPFVFLHGSGCDSTDWDTVFPELPSDRTTIRMDFRGHGQSDVPDGAFAVGDLGDDILVLLDHLSAARAILVGHSLGGMVALDLARRSDRVAGLVLLEGWTSLEAAFGAFTADRFYGTLDEPVIERIRRKSMETRDRFPPGVWEDLWASVRTLDALPYLRAARIPILEAYGGMGRTQETFERLSIPANPAIRVVWIPNSGHYLPNERPADVARLCREAAAWNTADA
jgi:pimeloyl-ACP methyl ester carboxylesterase